MRKPTLSPARSVPKVTQAFTLIELLVVIAIVAILAAILFPVFAQAKRAAKTAVTMSNQKQLGTGFLLYAGDSDDLVPITGKHHPGRGKMWTWNPYDQYDPYKPGHFLLDKSSLLPYLKSKEIFTSPLDPTARQSGMTFALNACMTYDTPTTLTDGIRLSRSLTAIEVPGEQMFLGEEAPTPKFDAGTNDGYFDLNDQFSNWHAGRSVVTFADMHSKSVMPKPIRTRLLFGTQTSCPGL